MSYPHGYTCNDPLYRLRQIARNAKGMARKEPALAGMWRNIADHALAGAQEILELRAERDAKPQPTIQKPNDLQAAIMQRVLDNCVQPSLPAPRPSDSHMGGKSRVQQAMEAERIPPLIQRLGLDPSKYSKAYDRRCHDYALLGGTDEEIAGLLGVAPETFIRWVVEQPSLARALSRARIDAPARVVKSLHRAANGYKHRETKLNVINGKLIKTDVSKAYPPSVQAAQLILTNRVGKHWKDTKSVEHSGRVDLAALISDLHGSPAKPVDPVTIEHEPGQDDDEE